MRAPNAVRAMVPTVGTGQHDGLGYADLIWRVTERYLLAP